MVSVITLASLVMMSTFALPDAFGLPAILLFSLSYVRPSGRSVTSTEDAFSVGIAMSTDSPGFTGAGSSTMFSSTGAGRSAESFTVMVNDCSSGPSAPTTTLSPSTSWVFTVNVPVLVGVPFRKMCLILPKLRGVAVIPSGSVESSISNFEAYAARLTRISTGLISLPVQ